MGIIRFFYLTFFILTIIVSTCFQAQAKRPPKRFASNEINTRGMKQLYNEPFNNKDPKTLQRTKQWLQLGTDGSWVGRLENNTYKLINSTGPNEVTYFYVTVNSSDLTYSVVEVDVDIKLIKGTAASGAGLIWHFNRQRRTYYAFVLQKSRSYACYIRDKSGFQKIAAGSSFTINPSGFNRIAIVGKGPGFFDLFVNGRLLTTVKRNDPGLNRGITGLVAMSTGLFSFDNFRILAPKTAPDTQRTHASMSQNDSSSKIHSRPSWSGQKNWKRPVGRSPSDASREIDKYFQQFQKPNVRPGQSARENRRRTASRHGSKSATGATSTQINITSADVAMARDVIRANTRSLPGFGVGSRVKVGSGKFSASDALVLYMLKFHHHTKVCPPIAVVAESLKKLNDTRVNKKSVAIFWKDYSTSSDLNSNLSTPNAFRKSFDWYILIKGTERAKIANMRLQGFVGADSAWRKAMNSQHQFWEKSRAREDEFILKRGAYRALLNSQAAVAAAERAVRSGY